MTISPGRSTIMSSRRVGFIVLCDPEAPLHMEILNGREKRALSLIRDRPELIHARDGVKGVTPLMLASQRGMLTVMIALVQTGAEVEAKDCHGQTALVHAVLGGKESAALWLIETARAAMPPTAVDLAADLGMASLFKAIVQ